MPKMELDWTYNEEEQRNTVLQHWSGDQKGGGDQVDQKQHGGEWLKTKDK